MNSEILKHNQPEIPNRALRLTLSYEDGRIELKSRKALTMRTPPSDSFKLQERESGFWFQVQDANGNLLYRKIMDNPVKFDIETISDQDPERPFTRIPISKPQGIFFILVPLFHEAQTIDIFSSPFEPERKNEPAKKITTFGLVSTDRNTDFSFSSDDSQNPGSNSSRSRSPRDESNSHSDVHSSGDNVNKNNSGLRSGDQTSKRKNSSVKKRGK